MLVETEPGNPSFLATYCAAGIAPGGFLWGAPMVHIIAGNPGNTKGLMWDDQGNLTLGFTYGDGGKGMLRLAERASPPSSAPVGGGSLYIEGGALWYIGSSGTKTKVAPA